jgi:hypothetical protein
MTMKIPSWVSPPQDDNENTFVVSPPQDDNENTFVVSPPQDDNTFVGFASSG